MIPHDSLPSPATFHLEDREMPTVFVQMDIPIGYSISSQIPNVIPFVAMTNEAEKYGRHYHRWQVPLEPAFGCTTHKMQGATAKYGAVIEPSVNVPFSRGLDYVAASRPTQLNNLFLFGPLTTKQFTAFAPERCAITCEYERLRNVEAN